MMGDGTHKRPILVTGSFRTGTTWVAKMIGRSREVAYLDEPFNKDMFIRVTRAEFATEFPYLKRYLNDSLQFEQMARTLSFDLRSINGVTNVRDLSAAIQCLSVLRNFVKGKLRRLTPLIKDPLAILSAEWYYQAFGTRNVIMIRHPAAVIASLKRLKWEPPLLDILKQELLMREHLSEFRSEIERCLEPQSDMVDRAILFWKVVYRVVDVYRATYGDWLFVRHEDVSKDPIGKFGEIFEHLGLKYTPAIRRKIEKYSSSRNPSEVELGEIRLNSIQNIYNWKKRLTREEILRIRNGVATISAGYYRDDEW